MIATTKARPAGRKLLRAVFGLPVAAVVAGIGYSALGIPHALDLPPALGGERRAINGRAGQLSYYVAGTGEPLLLIHSINAAASAYEVRPLFERYRASRRVYALELPGFGFSERSERDYTPRLYADAILDMLDAIKRETGADAVDALALSLSSEFLARAASEHPERFNTLALVSPTGMRADDQLYGPPGSVRGSEAARAFFEFPLWGQAFFDLLNSRVSARYFLAKTFGSEEAIDQGLLEYDYLTAHQPGARHAPFAFVSGLLFSADISRVYESLAMPVFMAYGVRGDFTDYGGADKFAARANWARQVFQTGSIPYFEQPEAFTDGYDAFLSQALAHS
jgi:pimeloyl-ACP methyl ester carboxylesterase